MGKKRAVKSTTSSEKRHLVFVSHATYDKWIAKVICEKLEAPNVGAQTFRDDRDIDGGDSIPATIMQTIRECDEFVVQYECRPVTEIESVATRICESKSTLTDLQLEKLIEVYSKHAVPVDHLILNPAALSNLTDDFNVLTGNQLDGERVARSLMGLRKAGKLPRVKMSAHPA